MSNGVLGKCMSQASVNVPAYTVPTSALFATISICCVNLGTTDTTVKLSIGTSVNPSNVDYIDFNAVVPANGGVLERNCITCSPGENVIINASTGNLATRVYGLEQL